MENTEEIQVTKRPRRVKEAGIISQVWNQSGATIINTGSTIENTVGIIKDSIVLGREMLKPSNIDARVETLTALAEGIADLGALGINEVEAREYLTQNI